MAAQDKRRENEAITTIDVFEIAKLLLSKIKLLIIFALIFGLATYSYLSFFKKPQYKASIQMYVYARMSNYDYSNTRMTYTDLAVAADMINRYSAILTNVSTMRKIISDADLDITENQLASMVSITSIDETEVFEVSVVHPDAKTAANICNVIGEVLPKTISKLIDGSSVTLLNKADVPTAPVSSGTATKTLIAALLGAIICAAVIVIRHLTDTSISSENDFEEWDYPILSGIPDIETNGKDDAYAAYGGSYEYGYTYGRSRNSRKYSGRHGKNK